MNIVEGGRSHRKQSKPLLAHLKSSRFCSQADLQNFNELPRAQEKISVYIASRDLTLHKKEILVDSRSCNETD